MPAAAYGAAALAFGHAAWSLYWTAGGTVLLDTVGGSIEDAARRGGAAAVVVGLVTVALKVIGGLLALALPRPWGRRTAVLLERTALAAGALLALYGGVLVVVGAVALTGALGEPADPHALRWHVLLWDPWFLLWGLLLLAAVLLSRAAGRRSGGPGPGPAR